jgi:acetyl esterase/lipase
MLNATIPGWHYTRITDQAYGTQPRQKLDVYRPKNAQSNTPIVIFFYGGDWQSGSKGDYEFVGAALSGQGFVAVLPDYRLYPQVQFPAFVQDGALAVRWVHQHAAEFGGDPNRIYLMGHSAGAHIAALLTLDAHYLKDVGVDRSVIRGTAALAGPYDFVPAPWDRGVFGMTSATQPMDAITQPIHFVGNRVGDHVGGQVDSHTPPMLIVTGMKDARVDPAKAKEFAEKIKASGGDSEFVAYPKLNHPDVVLALAWDFRWLGPVLKDCARFFEEHP